MTLARPRPAAAGTWATWELPALVVTLAAALVLRLHDYAAAPAITDNGDELDWTWQGLGILRRGVPYGWSNLTAAYGGGTPLFVNGKFFEVVHPYVDHPPLFGLLAGLLAWLRGARELTDVTAQMIRPLPIACSLLALVLAYALGRRLLGSGPAIAGVVLLATSPAAVLVQRQVEAESLLAPMLLGALLLAHRIATGRQGRWAVAGMLVICAVAPLVKVSGIAVAGGLAAVMLVEGRWRLAAASVASGVAGVLAFFAWGALYDWQLFLRVLAGSEARRSGILGVYHFIAAPAGPAGANLQLHDGWWLLGWLAVAMAIGAQRERRLALLLWPLVAYAVVIMLFAEHVSYYGWFRIAVYPIVYLLAGWTIWRAVAQPSPFSLLLVLTVGAATTISPLFAPGAQESWAPNVYLLLGALAVAVIPGIVASALRTETSREVGRYAALAAASIAIGANVAASLNLASIYRVL